MQKNGWNLFQFKPFAQRLQALTQDVSRLAQADPDKVRSDMSERGFYLQVPPSITSMMPRHND